MLTELIRINSVRIVSFDSYSAFNFAAFSARYFVASLRSGTDTQKALGFALQIIAAKPLENSFLQQRCIMSWYSILSSPSGYWNGHLSDLRWYKTMANDANHAIEKWNVSFPGLVVLEVVLSDNVVTGSIQVIYF